MKKIVRLTESELKKMMHESVRRALLEHGVDIDREIRLAQKALMKTPLSEVGLRLEGTPFYKKYVIMRDAIVDLNDSLIKFIRSKE